MRPVSNRRLARRGSRAAGTLAAVVSGLLFAGVCVADADVGRRVTVGVYGDSVVEGYTIPDFLRTSLVPQLRAGLTRAGGFQSGGSGLIPMSPFRWHFSDYTVAGKDAVRPDAWILDGFNSTGVDGPSGYGAIASASTATATAPIDGPIIDVLFTKFPGSGVFTVTAGSRTFTIDARSSGPPTSTEQLITVPTDARTITVHGPSSGILVFNGVIVRKAVGAGRVGIELENLGHMGQTLEAISAPRILATLRQQRFDVSVFLTAYLWELRAAGGDKQYEAAYARELRARAGLVRGYGGLCLIADPSPLPVAASISSAFAAVDRRVAHDEGCAYTGALTHLWDAASGVRTGITLIDGVHPRASGYRLMTAVLVPELIKLIRARVRIHPGR